MMMCRMIITLFICFISTLGFAQWNSYNYFNTTFDFANDLQPDLADKVLIIDSTYFVGGLSGHPDGAWLLFACDFEGNLKWSTKLQPSNSDDYAADIIRIPNTNLLLIAGLSHNPVTGVYQNYLVKVNLSGDTIWTKTFGDTSEYNATFRMIATDDNNYLMIGSAQRYNGNDSQVELIKIDENGNILWDKQMGNNYWELPIDALLCDDGGFLICGYRHNVPAGDRDILLIRTDSLGNELWEKTYGGGFG